MSPSNHPRITEVAFTKNEGRFLLEWIAYHRLIGVSDFLIYTNDCEDGSPELLDRLGQMGIVVHVPNPIAPGEKPQTKALDNAATHPLVRDADWVLQIDPDEFLCIKTGDGHIRDLIATAPDADCITIQMRFFGDSGLENLGGGLVAQQLTGSSKEDFELNQIVKSLARNGPVFSRVTANHMPIFPPGGTSGPRIFNCGGTEIPPEAYERARFRKIPDAYRSMRHAQLNHYAVKTFSDYEAKKYRGTAADNDKKLQLAYWRARNRNDVRDETIAPHLPAIKAQMEEWLRDPELANRHRACFEAYAEIQRKSKNIFGRRPVRERKL